ncbi:hypothetical protein EON67_02250 [archaeon]|nr:MAG: hypothetical protein EON67_02250 [archaeon]
MPVCWLCVSTPRAAMSLSRQASFDGVSSPGRAVASTSSSGNLQNEALPRSGLASWTNGKALDSPGAEWSTLRLWNAQASHSLRHAHAGWAYLSVALAVNIGAVLGGVRQVGSAYTDSPSNILTPGAVFGFFVFLAGISAGPLLLGLSITHGIKNGSLPRAVRLALVAAYGAACVGAIVLAATYLLQAHITFRQSPAPDPLKQLMGGFITVVYSFLALACFIVVARAVLRPAAPITAPTPRPIQPGPAQDVFRQVLLLVLYGIVWFLTSFMSSVWNYSATSYFTTPSTYSLVSTTMTFPSQNGMRVCVSVCVHARARARAH